MADVNSPDYMDGFVAGLAQGKVLARNEILQKIVENVNIIDEYCYINNEGAKIFMAGKFFNMLDGIVEIPRNRDEIVDPPA